MIYTVESRFVVAGLLLGLTCSAASSMTMAATTNRASSTPEHGPASATLTVSPNPVVVSKGDSKQAAAVVTLTDGSKKDVTKDPETKWTSDNTKTATVDANGHVVGVGVGVTNIKASFEGTTSSIAVTVAP